MTDALKKFKMNQSEAKTSSTNVSCSKLEAQVQVTKYCKRNMAPNCSNQI